MERSEGLPDYIAAPDDADGLHTIWPGDGVPPGSEGWDWHEQSMIIPWSDTNDRMVWNVVVPTLSVFSPPAGQSNGTALIIAPGGAFHFLMVDHEGHDLARRLTEHGVTSFVLRYRLARSPDTAEEMLDFRNNLHKRLGAARSGQNPDFLGVLDAARGYGEEDARQAMRFVRQNADRFGIDPARLGLSGFSAGGAVATGAVLSGDAETHPAFLAPIYAAPREAISVPADAPPLFTVIADDDPQVPPLSAVRLYEAWRHAGISAEFHVFASGGHGFGMRQQGTLSDAWYGLFKAWLSARGLI